MIAKQNFITLFLRADMAEVNLAEIKFGGAVGDRQTAKLIPAIRYLQFTRGAKGLLCMHVRVCVRDKSYNVGCTDKNMNCGTKNVIYRRSGNFRRG